MDDCLGKYVVAALVAAGIDARPLTARFPGDTPDAVWMMKVGEDGLVVLTKDRNLRYKPNEKAALINSRLRVFMLSKGNLRKEDMAELFIRNINRIDKIARKFIPPFVARVNRDGVHPRRYGESSDD